MIYEMTGAQLGSSAHHYKVVSFCFKMVERFDNLDNILRDLMKEKIPKSLIDALNRFEKQEEEKKPILF